MVDAIFISLDQLRKDVLVGRLRFTSFFMGDTTSLLSG